MKGLNQKIKTRIKTASTLLLSSLLFATAINVFISPSDLYTGGITGLLLLMVMFIYDLFGIKLSLSILVLAINIPLLLIAWRSIGKRFARLTVITVILQSIFLEVVPDLGFSDDLMLNAIFGGVLLGAAAGIVFRIGGSGGGMDIILQMLSYKFDGSIGKYSFTINLFIIIVAGYYQSWEIAMYTIMTIFIIATVVDRIHTVHKNLTLYIVTAKETEVIDAVWLKLNRGITVLEASGAYTKEQRSVLMVVLSSYELYETVEMIESVDEKVFINVVKSEAVIGNYLKRKVR